MKNIKLFLVTLIFISAEAAIACPSCIGSMEDSNYGNIVYILGGFILLTYIPFYLIYKTIIKNKNFNQELEDGSQD